MSDLNTSTQTATVTMRRIPGFYVKLNRTLNVPSAISTRRRKVHLVEEKLVVFMLGSI